MNASKKSFQEPGAGPSDLKLDQYLRGELSESEREVFELNIPQSLQKRLAERRAERDAFPYEAPAFSKIQKRRGRETEGEGYRSTQWFSWRIAGAAASLCALALVVIVVGRGDFKGLVAERPAVQAKGAFMNVYVKRGERVLQTESLRPGDRLAFELTSERERFGAVLSVDGAQKTNVYAPQGARMARVKGVYRFDHSIELDAVIGRERLVGFLCDKEFALDALRSWTSDDSKPPAGCERMIVDAEKRR